MPQCYRCERVQATAEVRRVRRAGEPAFVCKDNGVGSRCWTIVRELRARARDERRAGRREAAQATGRAEAFVV
jgi:hypothetical protein